MDYNIYNNSQYEPSNSFNHQTYQAMPQYVESRVISQKPAQQQQFISHQQQQQQQKAPKIKNTAYNTPIGLYSSENLKKELHNKIG
jgi:hypothetical protein